MSILTPEDKTVIEAYRTSITGTSVLTLVQPYGGPDADFEAFCDDLSIRLPQVSVVREASDEVRLPEIRLSENVRYSAVPIGKELGPFLEVLELVSGRCKSCPPTAVAETLARVDLPAVLTLYVSEHCPHCPQVVRSTASLVAACDRISLWIIDGVRFQEVAAADGVSSVPCLILDKCFRWTGQVQAGEVASMIADRDPAQLSASTLRTILEEGRASWIVEQMTEREEIFPEFIELVVHPIWSVRLGAMVVIEEMAEASPDLSLGFCPPLWERFDAADVTVKGDILYALGQAGDRAVQERLKELCPVLGQPDLVEACQDAVEAIGERLDNG